MIRCKEFGPHLALILVAVLSGRSGPAYATGALKYPSFEAETKIQIIGEPELGKPFEVEFTFTPLVDCYHSRGIPDAAYLRSEKGVKFLSGDTSWTGFLEKGNQHSLRAQYVVDSAIFFRFKGRIVAMEVFETIPQPNIAWKGEKRVGARCVKGANSRPIDLRSEEQKLHQQRIPILLMTDSGLVSMGSTLVTPPDELKVRNPDVEIVTGDRPSKKGRLRTREDARRQLHRKADLPIRLDSSVPDTIQVTYYPGRPFVFVTDTSKGGVSLELLSGNGRYEEIDGKRGVFHLESDSAAFRVCAGELERVLIVKKAQFYWIDGESRYRDFNSVDHANRHISLHVYVSSDGVNWQFYQSNVTDSWGEFSFYMGDDWVRVYAISQNALTQVLYADDHYFSPPDDTLFWLYAEGVQVYNPGHVDMQIPDTFLYFDELWQAGAFSILDHFWDAQDFLTFGIGQGGLPAFTATIWDDLDNSDNTSSYGGFTWGGVKGFYIASSANDKNNWDEWDESVLMHEYGHLVMAEFMQSIP